MWTEERRVKSGPFTPGYVGHKLHGRVLTNLKENVVILIPRETNKRVCFFFKTVKILYLLSLGIIKGQINSKKKKKVESFPTGFKGLCKGL